MPKLWDNTLFSIRHKLDPHRFNRWFKPIVCTEVTASEIVLEVPDKVFYEWLQKNFLELLQKSLREHAERDLSIRFIYGSESTTAPIPTERLSLRAPVVKESSPERAPVGIQLDPRYTFETFVVGASNQFAHAACAAVADDPGQNYNPLFIYGGVGLGKTHLLHAIGNKIRAERPSARIQYLASEHYINDLISSIRSDRMDEFRVKYRNSCDVLLVDDIQFIAGKDRTQIEFFHTFNALFSERKQIVVTSDRVPREMQGLEERLRSRFQWGLIADVQAPELETRVAILKAKAILEGIDLKEDVAMFLAEHVKSNVRQLEGSLTRLAAHSRLNRVPIDLAVSRAILADVLAVPGPTITIPQVQKLVAHYFNVTVSDLKGARRHRAIALPRMIAMFLVREHTPCSYPEIGKRFGNRDHSTVISAVKKITQISSGGDQKDEPVRVALKDLKRSLQT